MKHVIILTNKRTKKKETYSNLRLLLDVLPIASYNSVNNYISRKKVPFENEDYIIEKSTIIRGDTIDLGK